MIRISEIKRKSSKSPYYLIHFEDDSEPMQLHRDVYFQAHLVEGMSLDEERILELSRLQDRIMCRASAWRILTKQPRSRLELQTSLRRKYPKDIVEEIIQDLESKGHMNDKVYGDILLGELASKGQGIHQIRRKARQKGLQKDLVEDLLEKHLDEDQQEATARRLLEKWKNRSKKYPSPAHKKQAGAQFLARKGYEPDLIWNLIEDVFDDSDQADYFE